MITAKQMVIFGYIDCIEAHVLIIGQSCSQDVYTFNFAYESAFSKVQYRRNK